MLLAKTLTIVMLRIKTNFFILGPVLTYKNSHKREQDLRWKNSRFNYQPYNWNIKWKKSNIIFCSLANVMQIGIEFSVTFFVLFSLSPSSLFSLSRSVSSYYSSLYRSLSLFRFQIFTNLPPPPSHFAYSFKLKCAKWMD